MKIEAELNLDGIRDEVAQRAALQVAEMVEPSVRTEVIAKVLEIASQKAAEEIARVFSEPFVQTSPYGERKGEPMTLRELINAEAVKMLNEPAKGSGSFAGDRRTFVQELVRAEVERGFGDELRKALKSAKAEVTAAVCEKGAQVLKETLERMAEGR